MFYDEGQRHRNLWDEIISLNFQISEEKKGNDLTQLYDKRPFTTDNASQNYIKAL